MFLIACYIRKRIEVTASMLVQTQLESDVSFGVTVMIG